MSGTIESAKVGKRGAIIVPARLRKRFGIEEGTLVIAEEKEDVILIRPATIIPVERYSSERKAGFLLPLPPLLLTTAMRESRSQTRP